MGSLRRRRQLSLAEVQQMSAPEDAERAAGWLNRELDDVVFRISSEPIDKFSDQIEFFLKRQSRNAVERRRTAKIIALLQSGKEMYPIFVGDIPGSDSQLDGFILEGQHRLVAFFEAGVKNIPVIYVSPKSLSAP